MEDDEKNYFYTFSIFYKHFIKFMYRKNINHFVSGSFFGENCCMEILEISKEVFDASNGLNVVQDKSDSEFKDKYYSVNFSFYDNETDSYIEAVFNELTYTYRTTAEPCIYYDKNNNSIFPDFTSDQKFSQSYQIQYNEKGYWLVESINVQK